MRKHRQLACAATLVAALAMAAPAAAAPQVDTSALRNAVTYDGIHEHLAALQALAVPFEVGGAPTRATGTDGHWNSVDVRRRAARAPPATSPSVQPFEADIFVGGVRRVRAQRRSLPALRRRDGRLVHRRLLRHRRRDGGGGRGRLHAADRPGQRIGLRLRGRRLRPRGRGQDRPAAARDLRLRPEGGARRRGRRDRRGDLQRGDDRPGRPQRRADPDAGRLHRHHPGRRHRLRHGLRARAGLPGTGRRDRHGQRAGHRPAGRGRRPT